MAQLIRVTQTKIYEYEPDFEATAYLDGGIDNVKDALAFDKADYENGKIALDDLCDDLPRVTATWEIIDVPGT